MLQLLKVGFKKGLETGSSIRPPAAHPMASKAFCWCRCIFHLNQALASHDDRPGSFATRPCMINRSYVQHKVNAEACDAQAWNGSIGVPVSCSTAMHCSNWQLEPFHSANQTCLSQVILDSFLPVISGSGSLTVEEALVILSRVWEHSLIVHEPLRSPW